MSETNNKGVKVLASASLLFVTIIWGSAFVVMKNSMDAITPTYLLAYRFTIAALGMAALFWKQIRGIVSIYQLLFSDVWAEIHDRE